MVVIAVIIALTATHATAAETIISYKAASKSPPFGIKADVKSWQIEWKCDVAKVQYNIVPFSLSNPDNGHLIDAFVSTSATGQGTTIRTDKGRFLIDTDGNKCDVTVSKMD
ncbi:hypothetical protein DWF00_24620 [Bosea caraganae]|uniref:Uncharacterized protein n=1 Tax=Bosea caraganae TaxID=2763117 RepID=A0A370L0R0_9HYPH|nr:hypothetical protein [Bosea caraganae]RDJ20834.1 hypothetical protein DWE98_23005 [Bosea caraganae]RDJ21553.1 hypothetical protein DWF00_24620 [Bosea caraganae]